MIRVFTLTIVTMACSIVVCGQENERRMVADHSQMNFTAQDSQADGVVQIKLSQLFKKGDTTYSVVDRRTLADLPPLPTGFISFRDQGYKITTGAIASGEHTVIFHLPSVKGEAEASSPETMRIDEQVTHTFVIRNNGPVRAEDVNLRENGSTLTWNFSRQLLLKANASSRHTRWIGCFAILVQWTSAARQRSKS